jgi:cation diffusion facilitator family transporter
MKTDNKLDEAQSISYTKLALSFLLTVLKLLAGFFGNSTLLLADAVRSFSEFVNELVKFLDLFIANKPGDRSHNYGHGKIATLCLGAGACIFLFAGLNVFFQGSEQLLMFIQGREFETPKTIALFAAISAFVSRDIIFTNDYELQTREKPSKGRIYNKNSFVSGFIILGIGSTFLPGRILNITDSLAAVLVSLCLLWTSSRFLYRAADELIEASLDEDINRGIEEITEQEFDSLLNVQIKGPFSTIKAAIPEMKKQQWGRIINFSSRAAAFGSPNIAYSTGKAAMIGFTVNLAAELDLVVRCFEGRDRVNAALAGKQSLPQVLDLAGERGDRAKASDDDTPFHGGTNLQSLSLGHALRGIAKGRLAAVGGSSTVRRTSGAVDDVVSLCRSSLQ